MKKVVLFLASWFSVSIFISSFLSMFGSARVSVRIPIPMAGEDLASGFLLLSVGLGLVLSVYLFKRERWNIVSNLFLGAGCLFAIQALLEALPDSLQLPTLALGFLATTRCFTLVERLRKRGVESAILVFLATFGFLTDGLVSGSQLMSGLPSLERGLPYLLPIAVVSTGLFFYKGFKERWVVALFATLTFMYLLKEAFYLSPGQSEDSISSLQLLFGWGVLLLIPILIFRKPEKLKELFPVG